MTRIGLIVVMMLFPSTGWACRNHGLVFGWSEGFYRQVFELSMSAMVCAGIAMFVSFVLNQKRKVRHLSYVTRISFVVGVLMLVLSVLSFCEFATERCFQPMHVDAIDVTF